MEEAIRVMADINTLAIEQSLEDLVADLLDDLRTCYPNAKRVEIRESNGRSLETVLAVLEKQTDIMVHISPEFDALWVHLELTEDDKELKKKIADKKKGP